MTTHEAISTDHRLYTVDRCLYSFVIINPKRASRVTVVVPCLCVCVCIRSFLPPRASRPRNIGTYVFTATRKNFYNRDFR